MAEIIIRVNDILENIAKVNRLMKKNNMQWSLIVKVLSGNQSILEAILKDKSIRDVHSVGDSRIENLKLIKSINSNITTAYIRMPTLSDIPNVVKYADISYNTTLKTLQVLNAEAYKQNKIHKVVIMIELGELREGILGENLVALYRDVFALPNINIIGIGSNLGCMYGIEPTYDKIVQLALYKKLLEVSFQRKMDLVSGGTSITLPLLGTDVNNLMNHFRVGEAVFLGTTPLTGKKYDNLSTVCFRYYANIIELEEKLNTPEDISVQGNVGYVSTKQRSSARSYKAVLDFGMIDADAKYLQPIDHNIEFVGTTSDMTVYSLGDNIGKYTVGDRIEFRLKYMSVAKLMTSKYVIKTLL